MQDAASKDFLVFSHSSTQTHVEEVHCFTYFYK